MWYLGGKHRQSKAIVAAVQDLYPDFTHYVEPFCGALGSAAAMATRFPDRHFILSDANPYLIRFWSAAILEGWNPPEQVTLADWAWYKEHRPVDDPMTGYVGFAWAWLGSFFGAPAMDKKHNPPRFHGSCGGCMRKIEILRRCHVDMRCCSYETVCVPAESMVYLDPPYTGRTKQSKDNADLNLAQYLEFANRIASRPETIVIATEFTNHYGWEVLHNWGNTIAPRGSRKDKPVDPTEELLMLVLPSDNGGPVAKKPTPPAPKTKPKSTPAPALPLEKTQPKPKAQSASAFRSDPGDETASKARPLSDYPDLEDVLPDLCTRYREITTQMKTLEEERKDLSEQIMPLLEAAEAESVHGDGWLAMRVNGSRSSISREKLLERGVSMKVIVDSTTVVHYAYVQVREAAALPTN